MGGDEDVRRGGERGRRGGGGREGERRRKKKEEGKLPSGSVKESKDVFLSDGESRGLHILHLHVLQLHSVLQLLLLEWDNQEWE